MSQKLDVPNVHGVDEWRASIGGPHALIGELGHVPHNLVHDLRKLNRMARGAVTATSGAATTVCDVGLVVVTVEVDTVPTTT